VRTSERLQPHVSSICVVFANCVTLSIKMSWSESSDWCVQCILTRLDCCNCALAELPAKSLKPLERVTNTAVRLVMGLRPRDHITEAIRNLHGCHWRSASSTNSVWRCMRQSRTMSKLNINELVRHVADIAGRLCRPGWSSIIGTCCLKRNK